MRGVPGPETARPKALRWSELGTLGETPCPGRRGRGPDHRGLKSRERVWAAGALTPPSKSSHLRTVLPWMWTINGEKITNNKMLQRKASTSLES